MREDENTFVPISYGNYSDRERNYTNVKGVGARQQLRHIENTMMIRPERLQRSNVRYAVSLESGDHSVALSTEENHEFERIGLRENTPRYTTAEGKRKPTETSRLTRRVSVYKPNDKGVDDEIH